jgi:hypothetical protein
MKHEMSQPQRIESRQIHAVDPRWKDLYRLGGIFCIINLAIVVLAIVAFFIWPYSPGSTSTEETFVAIRVSRLAGVMSLDFFFLVGDLLSIPIVLALYVALRRVNESYALVGLVLGLIGVVSLIPSRPIAEIVSLSDLYAGAASDASRSHYLAAGEALLSLFNGTAWMVNIFLARFSYLISSLLMLRSGSFSKATAYVGLSANAAACGFLVPVVGPILLMLATIGGTVWLVQLARDLFQLQKQAIESGSGVAVEGG